MTEDIQAEAPKPRTLLQINQEYHLICAKCGDAEFQIRKFKSDQDGFFQQMSALDNEARALQVAQRAAAPAPIPVQEAPKTPELEIVS